MSGLACADGGISSGPFRPQPASKAAAMSAAIKAVLCRAEWTTTPPESNFSLEHDPEKWKPVFGQDHAPPKNLACDPIQPKWITG
jgi:hypothetical protein